MKDIGLCVCRDFPRTLQVANANFEGAMVTYSGSANGSITANIKAVGAVDWGRAYATVPFSVEGNRSVLVGWAYVSDDRVVSCMPDF